MDFLKKHYEKVLLGVVLLGLAVAVVFLMLKIPSEQQELEQKRATLLAPKIKQLTNLDLTLPEAALKRVATVAVLDFGPPNRLFNPMKRQRGADHLIRVDSGSIGPQAVVITKLTPLFLILKLNAVTVSDAGVARYRIGVERQGAAKLQDRGKTEKYAGVGEKNEIFKVEAAYGPTDNPTNLVLILNDSGEKASLANKDVPFQRVDGYLADLKYPPENKTWAGRRVGAQLTLNNEDQKIVAINKDEVILSSAISGKKTTIKYIAPP
jgi:hypothetical protein